MHGIKIQQTYTSLIYGSDNIHNACFKYKYEFMLIITSICEYINAKQILLSCYVWHYLIRGGVKRKSILSIFERSYLHLSALFSWKSIKPFDMFNHNTNIPQSKLAECKTVSSTLFHNKDGQRRYKSDFVQSRILWF